MKDNYAIEMLKIIANAIFDPTSVTNNVRERETLKYQRVLESNNTMNNNIYAEPENSNIEYDKSVPREDNKSYEDSKSYNDNKSNGYYNEQQDDFSDPQGVIDSITKEITPVRLQQAIILSEIVGKPRSKTRKKRRV